MQAFAMPRFVHQGEVLDAAGLSYNPCQDLIFPSVVRAGPGFRSAAPAPWLLYYAPHNAPGGICLALADDPAGPWREHPGNPCIRNVWPPHYAVNHVSSPHAVWNAEARRLFVYYHGENKVTRYATSADGVRFDYGGVALDADSLPESSAVSYARVYRRPAEPAARRWVMFAPSFVPARKSWEIHVAWSADGRSWRPGPSPLLRSRHGRALCAPCLARCGGRDLLLCHEDTPKPHGRDALDCTSDLVAFAPDPEFASARPLGVFHRHDQVSPDNDRVSDPCLVEHDGRLWLFHSIGTRLRQTLALAVAPAATPPACPPTATPGETPCQSR